MRGTLRRNDGRPPYRGIIPAYAGNTCEVLALFVACVGSSPRMRGTLNPATPEIDQTGIIPAYAGNTPAK